MMEEWRDVPGFEGAYQVSDQGRVRSCGRDTFDAAGRRLVRRPRVRLPFRRRDGYEQVNLSLKGRTTVHYVHRLVAAAFLGPCPEGMEVCHQNNVRNDSRAVNLRYDSPAGNQRDRVAHGTDLRGEAVYGSKLTREDVRRVKLLPRSLSARVVAKRFGVAKTTIKAIRTGRTWRHV